MANALSYPQWERRHLRRERAKRAAHGTLRAVVGALLGLVLFGAAAHLVRPRAACAAAPASGRTPP